MAPCRPPVPLRRAGGFALPARRWRCEPLWGDLGAWVVSAYGRGAERRSDWLLRPLVCGGACACAYTRACACV
nr:MAG TPA: hypothetical protein [Caudoviricetes sp.]